MDPFEHDRYREPTEDELAHDVLDMLEMGLTRRQVAERGRLGHGLVSRRRFRAELARQYQAFTDERARAVAAANAVPEHADPFVALDGRVATPAAQGFGNRSPRDRDEKRWFGHLVRTNLPLRRYFGGAPDDYELLSAVNHFRHGFIGFVSWRGRILYRGTWKRVSITMSRGDRSARFYISGTRMAPFEVEKIW